MLERERVEAVVADFKMGVLTSDEAATKIMSILGMDGLDGENGEAKRILEENIDDPLEAIVDEIDAEWELDPDFDEPEDDFDDDDDFDEDEPEDPEERAERAAEPRQ